MIRRITTLALVLALAAGAGIASAQSLTGSVTGKVVDAQGAVLPGVTVTVTGKTGAKTQQTDAQGDYRFLGLEPGAYSVKADLQGFVAKDQPAQVNVLADIALESFSHAQAERYRLTPDALRQAYPGLVVVSVTAFGRSGMVTVTASSSGRAAGPRPSVAARSSTSPRSSPHPRPGRRARSSGSSRSVAGWTSTSWSG